MITEDILKVLRVRVGLAPDDTTKDVQITGAWEGSVALAELYCDRKFDLKADAVEEFNFEASRTISLERYPLQIINGITAHDGTVVDVAGYNINKRLGLLYMSSYAGDRDLTVNYSGGYSEYPADLMQALLYTFDNVWSNLTSTTSGGSGAVPSGDVVAISVPDVGRIEFESFASGSAGQTAAFGDIPQPATAILWRYRREFA